MIFRDLFYFLLVILLSGCSVFDFNYSKTSRLKELKITKNFVKPASEQPLLRYRKINRAKPVVYGETLIVANAHDGITAFQRNTGVRLWHFFVPNGVEKEPLLFKDNLYFGGNNGYFYSIKAVGGSENWKVHIKSEVVTTPSLDPQEGRIYLLSVSNSLFALDAESGKQVWTYTRQDPSSYSIRGGTNPVISGNILYVGFSEGSFVAFNKANGTINWEIQLNKNKRFKDIDSTAVIDGERIYVSGYDDKLYCISSNNGDILWKFEAGGYAPVLIRGETLYYPATNEKLYSLNKNTAQKKWELALTGGIPGEVSFVEGVLAVGESQGKLLLIQPESGKVITSFDPGRGILSPISVNEKKSEVYFISGEANIYSLGVKWDYANLFSFVE